MYRETYNEVAEEAGDAARAREHEAFGRMIERLEAVASGSATGEERSRTLSLCVELWRFLIADLVDDRNALPRQLRADLVSLGMWAIRDSERLMAEPDAQPTALIEMHRTIREGLA